MLTLGSFAFAAPWALAGLVALPIIWWLLRVTPPAPQRRQNPAIRFLLSLTVETPARTPLWLILLRMGLAALAILALSQPLLNPSGQLQGSGPLVLVVDDGWSSARHWRARQAAMAELIDRAERADRRVILVTTAPLPGGEAARAIEPMRAADAKLAAQALVPRPWPVDRDAALARLQSIRIEGSANAVWLADGIEGPGVGALAERLQRFGGLEVVVDETDQLARLALPPRTEGGELFVPVRRAHEIGEEPLHVRASAEDGRLLAREEIRIAAGQRGGEVRLGLPIELRNRVHRIEIEGEPSAGAVVLVDERWRRRPVGLAFAGTLDASQPLLSELYYLQRALQPFSDLRIGTIPDLMRRELAVMVVPDVSNPTPEDRQRLARFVEEGGVLLRFAGAQLAKEPDELAPVTVRRGDRQLGGALSWAQPAPLAPFDAQSPFAGIAVPKDVTVARQVLAEPALDLNEKTWAKLADGTPIVTGEKRGRGWLVLVHTTAHTEWSNLAISGLFVEMLQRVVALSEGVAGTAAEGSLPPVEVLDGFGRPQAPTASATPIVAGGFAQTGVGPRHPPGFYGTPQAKRALNLTQQVTEVRPFASLPPGTVVTNYGDAGEIALRPWLLVAAVIVALIDLVIGYALRGLLTWRRMRAAPAAIAVLAALAAAGDGRAQNNATNDEFALRAANDTRLASVRTGNPAVDAVSRAGLSGLTLILNRRTAIEAAEPMEVDLERDELSFFPLLYWPITAEQVALTPRAVEKVNVFLKNGGTILFDTRDQGLGAASSLMGGGGRRLRQLAQGLQIGTLVPAPPDHVLTKAFYLLQDFPGRYAGGQIWVEQLDDRVNDGVSSVVIGGNDWAGAWAVDGDGRGAHAVTPGGERQREMAYRFGVNLAIYAFTGNYKADQVHVPAILERLGQ